VDCMYWKVKIQIKFVTGGREKYGERVVDKVI
jgi:hypothetical protein